VSVKPSGLPFWSRTNTLTSYGGHVTKAEFAGISALGGNTDLAAVDFNRLAANLATCSRTVPFATLSWTTRESTSQEPLVSYAAIPTGVYFGEPYDGSNPPRGYPSVTRSGNVSIVTFDSSYSDAYGVSHPFAPSTTTAKVTLNSTTLGRVPTADDSSGQLVVIVWDSSGIPTQDNSITLEAW
jgi:hypothetical protein